MLTSRKVNLIGACLGFVTVGFGAFSNPAIHPESHTCPDVQTIGGQICRGKIPKEMPEEAWGQFGAVAYQAAAEVMRANNAEPQPLTEFQKQYLRPHFGDLVDRVEVVYNATLMEDWVAASFKINVGESNAQVYGNTIYIKKEMKEQEFEQLVLLSHELIHCQQHERLGSLGNFGYHYFKEYKKAGESYRNNQMEVEAFDFEKEFAEWLSKKMPGSYRSR
ncbi:MAG: hypothetical protein ACRC8Y_16270 [Chroococcales cyanobacterium]